MESSDRARVKELFSQAIFLARDERDAWLRRLGDADDALREQLESLLAAHDEAGPFLSDPGEGLAPPEGAAHRSPMPGWRESPVPAAGTMIDRYRLLEPLGEGGFGEVWLAEQEEPVRRRVALKVVKPGMDTRQVIARFEGERQTLARMDHPCIASVFDGGVTASGRPYFVMELVAGIPITEYCDRERLRTHARLRLFQRACSAIQHAHQKGTIHRDIKPTNILVAEIDGVPVPKVIDFGIAKAMHSELGDRSALTLVHQILGTPDYMAPEQAGLASSDIDTRADIYSLGVLLYELLTGTKPFDFGAKPGRDFEAMLTDIRENDPPKPSTRVSALGDRLPEIARRRDIAPSTLDRALRGDLDGIVMKAISKDRELRYETVEAFTDDIERFLRNLPVKASPPSRLTLLRKYARRNRGLVAASGMILLALLGGLSLAIWGYFAADEQRLLASDRADDAILAASRSAMVIELLDQWITAANPNRMKGADFTAREMLREFDGRMLERLRGHPDVEATIRSTIGRAYRSLGLLDDAEPHLEAALAIRRALYGEDHEQVAESWLDRADLLKDRARTAEAVECYQRAIESRRRVCGSDHPSVAAALRGLSDAHLRLGEMALAEGTAREALAIEERATGGDGVGLAYSQQALAEALARQSRHGEAEPFFRRSLALALELLGEDHPSVSSTRANLANLLWIDGRLAEAEELYRITLDSTRRVYPADHPEVAIMLTNLGGILRVRGQEEEALTYLREAIELRRRSQPGHPDLANSLSALGVLHYGRKEYDLAEALYREALGIQLEIYGPAHPSVATSKSNLSLVAQDRGDLEAAESLQRESLAIYRAVYGEEHPEIAMSECALGMILRRKGAFAEAEVCYREALAMLRSTIGNENDKVAATLYNLGFLARRQERVEEAAECYFESLELRRRVLGETHSLVTISARSLASVFMQLRRPEDAAPLYEEIVAIERQRLPADSPELAVRLTDQGQCLLDLEEFAAAQSPLEEALQIRAQHLADSWLRRESQSLLGDSLRGQRRFELAEPLLLEGFREMQPPQGTPHRDRALDRVIRLYVDWERPDEAERWRAEKAPSEPVSP